MIQPAIRNEIRRFSFDNSANRAELAIPASPLTHRNFPNRALPDGCQTRPQFAKKTVTLIRAKALLECPDRAIP